MPAHTTASRATPQATHDARAPLARRRLVTHRYARPLLLLLLLLLSLPSLLLLLLLGPGSGGAAIPVNAQPDLQLRP